MSHIRICIVLLSCLLVEQTFAVADVGTYEGYQDNVSNYCRLEKPNIPNAWELWHDWQDRDLIKIEQIQYADMTRISQWDAQYRSTLRSVGGDPSKIDWIALSTPRSAPLLKASYVYSEAMGSIYACAVLNIKKKVLKGLLPQIKGQSNVKREFEKQSQSVAADMVKRGCRDISGTQDGSQELSIKRVLLDNTMFQYCNYRYYLSYLDAMTKRSANVFIQEMKKNPGIAVPNTTDQTAEFIKEQTSMVTDEMARAREIYPQAFVAYAEFERTYPAHILLTFILQDYIDMRDTLKQLINPIGQVIKKASNAQSPGVGSK